MMTDAKLTKSLSKLIATEVQSFHNISAKKTITLHSFVQTLVCLEIFHITIGWYRLTFSSIFIKSVLYYKNCVQ